MIDKSKIIPRVVMSLGMEVDVKVAERTLPGLLPGAYGALYFLWILKVCDRRLSRFIGRDLVHVVTPYLMLGAVTTVPGVSGSPLVCFKLSTN